VLIKKDPSHAKKKSQLMSSTNGGKKAVLITPLAKLL